MIFIEKFLYTREDGDGLEYREWRLNEAKGTYHIHTVTCDNVRINAMIVWRIAEKQLAFFSSHREIEFDDF
jgi:hypothetical protein